MNKKREAILSARLIFLRDELDHRVDRRYWKMIEQSRYYSGDRLQEYEDDYNRALHQRDRLYRFIKTYGRQR